MTNLEGARLRLKHAMLDLSNTTMSEDHSWRKKLRQREYDAREAFKVELMLRRRMLDLGRDEESDRIAAIGLDN